MKNGKIHLALKGVDKKMNVLLAGFKNTKFIDKGINYLQENGFNCWQSEDANEIVPLTQGVIFDVIVVHLSFAPLGLRFRWLSPRGQNSDSDITFEVFMEYLDQYVQAHDTKIIIAWINENWPSAAAMGGKKTNWADFLVNPDSAIEIITSIQRVIQQYPGLDSEYQRFFRTSVALHNAISEKGFLVGLNTIDEVLSGTDILFNKALMDPRSKLEFPLAITAWTKLEQNYYYYTPLRTSSIPIVTKKMLTFIASVEWISPNFTNT